MKSIEQAIAFYRDVLGLRHLYTFGKLSFFDCDGVRLFLEESSDASQEAVLYFRVPDIHAAHAELSERGLAFLGEPHLIHRHDDGLEEWMAFFNDPDDRPLAIMCQVGPSTQPSR